jgi:hypothetical protein
VIIFLLCATPISWAQQVQVENLRVGTVVPAGALLGCTLDEPNFSSQTARPGDPVLCKTTSLQMFGRTVVPRGAYLSARLRNYRDPGHFVGKGWLQLEFSTLTLPGGSVPVDAKVISAARYRVNGEGKIQGRGHPKRDAVEWAIPILWPVKVLTLPARGPRPSLKGETRIEVRLMEDVLIPDSAYSTTGALIPRSLTSLFRPDDNGANLPAPVFADFRSGDMSRPTQPVTSTSVEQYQTKPAANRGQSSVGQPRLTLLVLRGGRMQMIGGYWAENGRLYYTTGSAVNTLPLDALDMAMTRQLNAERGLPFIIAPRSR